MAPRNNQKDKKKDKEKEEEDEMSRPKIFLGRTHSDDAGHSCDIHEMYQGDLYVMHSTGEPLFMCVTLCAPRILHKLLRDYLKFYEVIWGPLSVPMSRTDPPQPATEGEVKA